MRQIRGGRIAMCFQDPMTFLNPVFRISDQISEAVLLHQKVSNAEAIEKAINTMDLVGIPVPKERVNDYPHHFSGGMRQRILLAIALSCNPELLIADEPTTALDVIIQAKVLDLMIELRKKIDSSILLITHDLGIVAQMADKVAIMYSGKIQEFADVETIYDKPVHPYTKGLLNSIPSLRSTDRMNSIKGEPPDPMNPPSGCRFHPRCPYADEKCKLYDPDYTMVENGHFVSCLKWEKMV
jgi:oligopeptide/dipeptide ABC transporter ATP-binding protein